MPSRSGKPPPSSRSPKTGARATHFRAYERHAVTLVIDVVTLDRAPATQGKATLLDLGFGGAGLETTDILVPGERVSLSFETPTLWDPLVVRGVVAWMNSPKSRASRGRAGVKFDYESADTAFAMFELMRALAPS